MPRNQSEIEVLRALVHSNEASLGKLREMVEHLASLVATLEKKDRHRAATDVPGKKKSSGEK